MTLLSTAMCDPSQANSSVAAWLESSEDSRVRTSRLLENAPASTGSDQGSGANSPGSLGRFDQTGYSLRTSQVSLITNQPEEFLETFPDSGSMRNGVVSQRQPLGPAIGASGGSAWPTPDAAAFNSGESPESFELRRQKNIAKHLNGNGMGTPLAMKAATWPSPRSEDSESCGNHPNATDSLTGASRLWETPHGNLSPTAGSGGGEFAKQANQRMAPQTPGGGRNPGEAAVLAKGSTENGKRRVGLESQSKFWSTPSSHDGRRPGPDETSTQGRNLKREGESWATPSARDWKDGAASEGNRNARPLNEQASRFSLPVPMIRDGEIFSPLPLGFDRVLPKRRLNVFFVLWLMGLPMNWLAPEPRVSAFAEMQSYQYALRQHLSFLLKGLD